MIAPAETTGTMETETVPTPKRHLRRRFYVVLAAIVLTIVSAGVAGQAMADTAGGDVNINADQTLGVASGTVGSASGGRVIISDDGASFKAPVECFTGDQFTINLALVNRSQQPLDLQVKMTAPAGFTLAMTASDGANGAVRMGPDTWALTLDPNENDYETDLTIVIAVSDVIAPGFYDLGCIIEPLTFTGGAS